MMHTSSPPTRSCPQCRVPLTVTRTGQIEVDLCPRCAGCFFDPGELTSTFGPDADPERWGQSPQVVPPSPASPCCPAGHGPMWRLPTSPYPGAPSVHACGSCRGAWIDGATLHALRAEAPTVPVHEGGAGAIGRYVFQLVSFMPVEVSNPVRRKPWVTWSLAASMALAFVALRASPEATRLRWEAMLMLSPSELRHGFGLLTPVTYAWLHINLAHLLGNLYFLVVFGDNIEDRFGRLRYLALLAGAAVFGALCEVAAHPNATVGVGGASGAVAGVLGAYMVLFPKTPLHVVLFFIPLKVPAAVYLVIWALLQVVGFLQHQAGVAWLAHLGGFFVGLGGALIARTSALRETS